MRAVGRDAGRSTGGHATTSRGRQVSDESAAVTAGIPWFVAAALVVAALTLAVVVLLAVRERRTLSDEAARSDGGVFLDTTERESWDRAADSQLHRDFGSDVERLTRAGAAQHRPTHNAHAGARAAHADGNAEIHRAFKGDGSRVSNSDWRI